MAKTIGLVFVDCARNRISLHQADCTERKGDPMFQFTVVEEIQLETAAAEIEDEAGLNAVRESPVDGGANEARFFLATDDFELDSGLAADTFHEATIIAGFASGGGGDGTVGRHVVAVHAVAEIAERARGAVHRVFIEQAVREGVVAQADGGAFGVEDLDLSERSSAGNYEPDGIRAGVNRCQLDRCGHS